MNLKKIMSGLLSLVLAAGMIPGTIAFAADEKFTNAWGDVIRKDDCLYYEDFENYTGTDFDISSDITDKGYWHNEVVSDGSGGRAMRYYATPNAVVDGATVKYDAKDGENLIKNKEILPSTTEINKNGWYEIGYTYYPDDMRTYMKSIFGVSFNTLSKNALISRLASHSNAYPFWLRHWIAYYPDGFMFRDGWKSENPTHIKVILDASKGDVICYFKRGKEEGQTKTVHGTTGNNTQFTIGDSGNINITISCGGDPVANAKQHNGGVAADEPGYRIDNFYVKKLPTYKLSFDKNDGTGIMQTQIISPVVDPVMFTPERDGYQFDGWYIEDECVNEFDKNNVSGNDMTVYAKWLKIHTITFESDGGTKIASIQTVTDTIEMPKDPIKFRHEFGGWFTDDTFSTKFDGTGISGDMTVYAKWTYAHEISFETNGGEPIEPIYTVNGVESVPDAVKVGYRFDGWFTDEELTNKFDCTNVTEDIKVYAAWTRKHVVSFETFGGEPIDVIYTLEDLDVNDLPKAVKPGFGFEGWFTDKDLTVEFDGKNITEDITLYAKYSNVIYHEDFENNYDNEMLKGLAPNNWQEWEKEGFGVVEDKNGNHEFRLASEANKTFDIAFPNGGEGLYEIEFKIRNEGSSNMLIGSLFAPMNGNKAVVTTQHNGGWFILNGSYMFLQMLNGGADLDGYITFKWRIDTVNNMSSMHGSYTNTVKRVIKANNERRKFGNDVNGLDAIRFAFGVNQNVKSQVYIDDIWVRKIEQPKLVSSTPENGTIDTELRPEIKLLFDRKLDSATITTSNVTITDENGTALSADDYTMAESLVDGNTEISISLKKDLEYATTYSVNVASDLQDTDGYFLANSYKVEFTTKPIRYEVTPSLVDKNGDEVKDITTFKEKPVTAKLYVRNFAGGENDNLFVSAALVDEATGRQLAYSFEEITLAKGEGKEVLNAEFQIPEDVTENYKVHYYVWNSRGERKAMTDSCVLPQ